MILYIDYTGNYPPLPGYAYFLSMCILEFIFCVIALYVVSIPDLLGLYIVLLFTLHFITFSFSNSFYSSGV